MNPTQPGSPEYIALDAIRPSTTNPRKHFDLAALNELAASIGAMGVTQPVLLRPKFETIEGETSISPVGFEIVSGERRYRAAKIAGLKEIPAFVRELTDGEALDIQMIENLQRADLHPMEEAEGYRHLLAAGAAAGHEVSAEDIAKKTGKTLAYVKQRIALLSLEADAKTLFADGHLTLDHALLLARLTPKDQERALRFLLALTGDYERTPLADAVKRRLRHHQSYTPQARVTNRTKGELRDWITSNVLLALKGVPWDLGDADLLPAAGACTTCPKRAGANAALFSDITTVEDTCTDPACFDAKRGAFVKLQLTLAKDGGGQLLKISAKHSTEKLEKPAVELQPGPLAGKPGAMKTTTKPVVVAKKAVREGQWLPARRGECPSVVQAIVTDGPDTGKTKWVCADQACKTHKHFVESPRAVSGSGGTRSIANAKQEQEKRARAEALEKKIDEALLAAIEAADAQKAHMLEFFLGRYISHEWQGNALDLCHYLSLKVTPSTKCIDYKKRREECERARIAIADYLSKVALADLHDVATALLVGDAGIGWGGAMDINLTAIATRLGIDAKAVAARVKAEMAAAEAAAKVDEKPAAVSKLGQAAKKAGKKTAAKRTTSADALAPRPNADFSKGVRGKHSEPVIDGKSAGAGAAVEARM